MRKGIGLVILIVSFLLSASIFSPTGKAMAQTKLFGLNANGDFDVGVRGLFGDRSSSKFNEYRDVHSGLYLDRFFLELNNPAETYFFNFKGENFIRDDQRYSAEVGRYGQYQLQVQWDQIPHLFSTTGRTLFIKQGRETFNLPDIIQTTIQAAAAADRPATLRNFLNGASDIDLQLRRDKATLGIRGTPTPEWDLRFVYSNEREKGSRPIGTSFSFGSQNELPEPIDYRTHTVGVSAEYGKSDKWVLKLSYDASLFNNEAETLIWDNPLRIADAAGSPARGLMPLYPDNQAHNITLSGAINLAPHTRFTATLSRGWMLQDENFLPFTINSAVAAPGLARNSLEGKIQTFLMNYLLTSRILPRLTLTGRYRLYDLDNRSRSILWPGHSVADTNFVVEPERNVPFEYLKQNGGVEASLELMRQLFWKIGWEWEGWHRRFREVKDSNEHTVKTAFDITPTNWLLFRTSYGHSWRNARKYDTNATEEAMSGEESLNLPLLRKFDEVDRGRDKVEFLAQFTPLSNLTFSSTFSLLNDDFDASYGFKSNNNNTVSFNITYAPTSRLTLFGGYTREDYFYKMTSRYRPVVAGVTVDDPANDWRARVRDLVHTFDVGLNGILLQDKLDLDVTYSISSARTSTRTIGTTGGAAAGEPVDYPSLINRLHQLLVSFNYHIKKDLTTRLQYRLEKLRERDYATDIMSPWMGLFEAGSRTSTYMGATMRGFEGHTIAGVLTYKF